MRKAKTKKEARRAWTKDEAKLLKRLFSRGRAREVAERIGRSLTAVGQKAYRLGLAEILHAWSKKDLNLLKELYPSETARQIADQIGRSLPAIQGRIHKLGLRKRLGYDDCHQVVNGTKEKLCGKCREWKGESQFCKSRSSKDGVQSQCKECKSKYARKRYERIRKAGEL